MNRETIITYLEQFLDLKFPASYREDTPFPVINGMKRVVSIPKEKRKGNNIILGEHGIDSVDGKGINWIYKHSEKALDSLLRGLLRDNPKMIKEELAEIERGTHYHEIGHEIIDKHLTSKEEKEYKELYQKAKEERRIKKI